MTLRNDTIRIFVSYSWNNTDIADEIEKDLSQFQIGLERDVRDLKYKHKISGFMERIRDANYALVLISDDYLKSQNCMTEVMHLLKEKNYEEKILPVIVGKPNIYSSEGRLSYSKYWQDKKIYLEKIISGHPPASVVNEISELKKVERIAYDINEFLGYIKDLKNVDFQDLKKEGYKSLLDSIGFNDISHLVELLIISYVSDTQKKDIMLDEWLEKYKPTTDSYSIKAGIARDNHDYVKAEINYNKALELNQNNAIALNNYGFMLMGQDKDHEKTKQLFVSAIKVIPHLTEARLNLGVLLTSKFDDTDGAIKEYEKIISYNPTEEKAYNNLANIYKGLHCHDKSAQKMICDLYEKAIQLKPDYIEARLGYSNYLSEFVGDYSMAESQLDAVNAINPDVQQLVDVFKKRIEDIKANKFKKKVPRNDPCPCGSGIKYKKCHGRQ